MAIQLGNFGNPKGITKDGTTTGQANAAGLAVGMGANIAGNLAGNLIGDGYTSQAGNLFNTASQLAGAIPGPWGGIVAGGAALLGGLTNRAFGSKMNQQNIATVENNIAQLRGFNSNAGDFDQFMSEASSAPTSLNFSNSFIGKDGWFGHKARRRARALRQEQAFAAQGVENSLLNNVDNLIDNQYNMLEANYAAFGGNIEVPQDNTRVYKPLILPIRREHNFSDSEYFWDSGFGYPSGLWKYKDGTFHTAGPYGKDIILTQEEADSIVRTNKAKKEMERLRQAMRRQKIIGNPGLHAFGGHLNAHGADWTNGIKYIENGGTHEENPNDGVQMGIAPDGEPNLVEEGEVIFNDYVFSNRLNVPQAIRNKYRLRGKKDLTFAEAAKKLQKEAEEMPNDAIAKRGLIASMSRLQNAQEALKGVNEFNDLSQTYGLGGSMFFDEGGKIRIAPSKKGTFTAAAKKHSMGVQEFASKVLANKDNYSPAMVKKANFARNAAKWHANGGHLFAGEGPSYIINWNDYPAPPTFTPGYSYSPIEWKLEAPFKPYYNPYKYPSVETTAPTSKPENDTWVDNKIPPLFYAPAIGSGVQAFTDLMGWTNRPNYSSSRSLMNAAANIPTVRSTPIGDYVAYTPFDRLFYANQLGNQAAGTRRNILNTSGGNRGMAMAGILAADAAAQTKLGELFRQADEFNLTNRFKGAEFNRGTNQYNSQNSLVAQRANIDVSKLKLNALQNALTMRDTERRLTDSNRSTNLTNFLTNLGNVGLQQFNNRQFNILGRNGYWSRGISNT